MKLTFSQKQTKEAVFKEVGKYLDSQGIRISSIDSERPWGGFFVVQEGEAQRFIQTFFPEQDSKKFQGFPKLSPKILIVAPGQQLSWQYHRRRAEIWKVLSPEVGVFRSYDDQIPNDVTIYNRSQVIELACLERHRLVGLEQWGIVAEIWEHTDQTDHSDEADIIRLEDSYNRK